MNLHKYTTIEVIFARKNSREFAKFRDLLGKFAKIYSGEMFLGAQFAKISFSQKLVSLREYSLKI